MICLRITPDDREQLLEQFIDQVYAGWMLYCQGGRNRHATCGPLGRQAGNPQGGWASDRPAARGPAWKSAATSGRPAMAPRRIEDLIERQGVEFSLPSPLPRRAAL